MASVNFSYANAFELYTRMFSNISAFSLIALALLFFIIILMVNIENRNMHFIFTALNTLLVLYIIIVYGKDIINNIDTFFKTNIFKNIYFFLMNTVISLVLINQKIVSSKTPKGIKYVASICFYFIALNAILMLFMSNVLEHIILLVLGNTYPMIYFGNIASFIIYGLLLLYYLLCAPKKHKHRFGSHV